MKLYKKEVSRIVALLICISFIYIFFLCENYIIEKSNHNCNSEVCITCMQIQFAERMIKFMGKSLTYIKSILLILMSITILTISKNIWYIRPTLVDFKVLMNN